MEKKPLHFTDLGAYQRWLAYGHMHEAFKVRGNQNIMIAGRPHKVKHER